MASRRFFFLVALFCTGSCNPLASLVGDTASILPNLVSNTGTTTVCDTTPNGSGFGHLLSSNGLQIPGLGGSTTVCETKPNMGLSSFPSFGYTGIVGLPPNPNITPLPVCLSSKLPMQGIGLPFCENVQTIPYPYPNGLILPGSQTICETPTNVPPFGMTLPNLGSTMYGSLPICLPQPPVCDPQANISPLPICLPNKLSLQGLQYCENIQNLPYPYPNSLFVPGAPTVCENTPNILPPIGALPVGSSVYDNFPYSPPPYPYCGLPFSRISNIPQPSPSICGGVGLPYGFPLNGIAQAL